MHKNLIILSIGIILTFATISCSKSNKIRKITGSWDEQFFDGNPDHKQNIWIFKDDGTLQIEYLRQDNNNNQKLLNSPIVQYTLQSAFLDGYYLYITGLGKSPEGVFFDGRYKIMKLSKSQLILQRIEMYGSTKGAFLRKEFVKL
jgi:hypothetical protein